MRTRTRSLNVNGLCVPVPFSRLLIFSHHIRYVVVNLSKDITVEDNKIVAKGVNRQTPAGLRLPLESAEAMRTHVVAKDQASLSHVCHK